MEYSGHNGGVSPGVCKAPRYPVLPVSPALQGGFEADDDAWRPQTIQEIVVVGHVCVGSTWQGDDKSLQGAGPNRLDRRQGHARLVAVVPLESLATSMVTCMLARGGVGWMTCQGVA